MIRKRRNAYLSAIAIALGVFLIGWGTFLPAVSVGSAIGFSAFHLSLKPTGSVDDSGTQPIILAMCFLLMIIAFLLALARRPGWGIAWRVATAILLTVPVLVVVDLWSLVADPAKIADDKTANVPTQALGYVAKLPLLSSLVSAAPGPGLWLMSFGALTVLVGCFLPSTKSRHLVIRDDDPRFQAVVDALQRFQPLRLNHHWADSSEQYPRAGHPHPEQFDVPRYYESQ